MTCYRPLHGYRSKFVNSTTGKRSIVFNPKQGYVDMKVTIPCGQCIGCRLERSRQWAMRCMHEASIYDRNAFITLTYNDSNLPQDHSLHLEDFQKFMKRLRAKNGNGIRFFHCGEYGEKFNRPHYHACLFNFDFLDKKIWRQSKGLNLYKSSELEELWPFGYSVIGDVTFESAAYVARYITKKINGKDAKEHYSRINRQTGEIYELKPEYVTMSRRPGIGRPWFDKYGSDVFPDDSVVVRGKEMKPPKFYDNVYEAEFPSDFAKIKAIRIKNAKLFEKENSSDRLVIKEKVKFLKSQQLKRSYENEI